MDINTKPKFKTNLFECRINDVKFLTNHAFEITFDKPFEFTAGQHIIVSIDDEIYDREYSICSAEEDKEMKILVKEVVDGYLTPILRTKNIGDKLKVRGPHGRFCLDLIDDFDKEIILIATGTGIAPFRSMIRSYKDVKFKLFHGIRTIDESYYKNELNCELISCTSRDDKGDYNGRVTSLIEETTFNKDSKFFLCGNFDMIYDVQNILKSKGFHPNSMYTEVYF